MSSTAREIIAKVIGTLELIARVGTIKGTVMIVGVRTIVVMIATIGSATVGTINTIAMIVATAIIGITAIVEITVIIGITATIGITGAMAATIDTIAPIAIGTIDGTTIGIMPPGTLSVGTSPFRA